MALAPTPAGRPRRLLVLGAALAAAGLGLQRVASRFPGTVEEVFSRTLYPRLGEALGCLTAPLPFSVVEAALLALAAWAAARLARAGASRRRPRNEGFGRRLGAGLPAAAAVAGAIYAAFLLLWGLNYQREPFAASAGLDTRPAGAEELAAVADALVAEANALRAPLAEDAAGVLRLPGCRRAALARTVDGYRIAAEAHPVLRGRCTAPKPVLLSPVLSLLGIAGIYSPFTGEANVNTMVPDAELPFDASHEVAHQRGFAREDEANYIGYLACRLSPHPEWRYSGTLVASLYALGALARADPAAARRVALRRAPAVARDVRAIEAWVARWRSPVTEVSERVNDAYLRSQGQREGARSYGRMVDLLIAERRATRSAGPTPRPRP